VIECESASNRSGQSQPMEALDHVPAGVVELMKKKQQDGHAHIRP